MRSVRERERVIRYFIRRDVITRGSMVPKISCSLSLSLPAFHALVLNESVDLCTWFSCLYQDINASKFFIFYSHQVCRLFSYACTRFTQPTFNYPHTYFGWNFSTWLFFFVIVAVVVVICLLASAKPIQIHRVHAHSLSSIPLWLCGCASSSCSRDGLIFF